MGRKIFYTQILLFLIFGKYVEPCRNHNLLHEDNEVFPTHAECPEALS